MKVLERKNLEQKHNNTGLSPLVPAQGSTGQYTNLGRAARLSSTTKEGEKTNNPCALRPQRFSVRRAYK